MLNIAEEVFSDFQSAFGKLVSIGSRRVFPKSFCIARPGETYDHCYLIRKGRVQSSYYTQNGVERTHDVLRSGDIFLLPSVVAQKPSPLYFHTAEVTDTVCINRGALLRAMLSDSTLMAGVTAMLADSYNELIEQMYEKNSHCITWKLCDLFLSLAEQYGKQYDGKTMIWHKISQETMGHLLGVSRVTVTRMLQDVKALRLIEYINGYYCIRDTETLRAYRDNSDLLRKTS